MKNFFKLNILFLQFLVFCSITGCNNQHNYIHKIQANSSSSYVDIDNGKLFYQRFGLGEPIIIVHGGPGLDQEYLLPQMLELAKDHELIFYDQRGSGRSISANIDQQYITLDQFSKDLDKLRAHLGLRKFILLGHSWGGLISMDYATRYPDNINSLILLNSCAANYEGRKSFMDEFLIKTKPISGKISALFDYNKFQKLDLEQINNLYKELLSIYFNDPSKVKNLNILTNKESGLSSLKVASLINKTILFESKINLLPALRTLNVPTLIVHGNQDIVPISTAKEIQDAIKYSSIVYLDKCGHFSYVEASDELFKFIRSFLNKDSNNLSVKR